jgi:thiol-disulfide isomerase/thioredoxin
MEKRSPIRPIKKWLTVKNLLNGLFFIVLILLLVNPSAKALVIRGLMKVGLFQPEISLSSKQISIDLNFRDTDGKTISLSSLRGKVIFINFWATWCPPCIAELPSINELHQQLNSNDKIVFLIVDADNDFGKSLPFMEMHHYNLPLYEAASTVPQNILGGSIPTTVVFDKQGRMVFNHEGAADYTNKEFVAYLNKLSSNR